ncbi:tetratricopeptide repeat protein [Thermoflavifilum thermophilum]|uniref:Uncharacterized protein n=1 Tax=Thermoflavifilum thermophilum TaxID=1393122 RepID=A0A1I7NKW8_9BACT|nr:hypothetical protein [Thermoflavifilum thermophilum]SFV35324.1 hypothetical protein SAMN05660895_2205 [Thermoflavifilum thermophilum]
MYKYLLWLILLSGWAIQAQAQQGAGYEDEQQALQLVAQMHEPEAFKQYQHAIAQHPHDARLYAHASLLASHLALITDNLSEKKSWLTLARQYADSAQHLDPALSDGKLAFAEATFQQALLLGAKEKINGFKAALTAVRQVIAADSQHAQAWNLLGRIQLQLATMSVVERSAARLLFGQIPDASLQQAIYSFQQCMRLDPRMISNYYDLATAYHANGQDEQAIHTAQRALRLKNIRQGDDIWKQRCQSLIKNLQ